MGKALFRVEHEWEEKSMSVAVADGDSLVAVEISKGLSNPLVFGHGDEWSSMEIDVESAREMARALLDAADQVEMLGRLS